MKIALLKILLLVGWSIPVATVVPVAIGGLLSWLAPLHSPPFVYVTSGFVVGVFPWLLLTYIATIKRLGIGWHWLLSLISTLTATVFSSEALSLVDDFRPFAGLMHKACSPQAIEALPQLQYMAVSCAVSSWLALTSSAFISTITAGAPIVLLAWTYRHFFSQLPDTAYVDET